MFPRFKALRSCDSDVLLPQQAHDDRLGHRCHEIPLPWTCHDLLWVAQCWLLFIDGLWLMGFTNYIALVSAQDRALSLFKSSEVFLQETTTRWTGPWMTSRWGFYDLTMVSTSFSLATQLWRSSSTLLRRSTAEPARAEVWSCHPRLGKAQICWNLKDGWSKIWKKNMANEKRDEDIDERV